MKKAFTLVELLIVIAILAVLSVVVFVVINPAQRLAEAQNTQVRSDVQTIQKAFELYAIDNAGAYPLTDDSNPIATSLTPPNTDDCTEHPNGTNMSTNTQPAFDSSGTIYPEYITSVLLDPFNSSNFTYRIYLHTPSNQVVVCGYLADGTTYYYPPVQAD